MHAVVKLIAKKKSAEGGPCAPLIFIILFKILKTKP